MKSRLKELKEKAEVLAKAGSRMNVKHNKFIGELFMEILKNPLIFTDNFKPAYTEGNILSSGTNLIYEDSEFKLYFEDIDKNFIDSLSICYKGQGMRLEVGSYSKDLDNSFDEFTTVTIDSVDLPDDENFTVILKGAKTPRELKHITLINKNNKEV